MFVFTFKMLKAGGGKREVRGVKTIDITVLYLSLSRPKIAFFKE